MLLLDVVLDEVDDEEDLALVEETVPDELTLAEEERVELLLVLLLVLVGAVTGGV